MEGCMGGLPCQSLPLTKMREVWKPVAGHEGCYEVSNLGCVRSVNRAVWVDAYVDRNRIKRAAAIRHYVDRMLRPGVQKKSGHVSVAIGKGNSRLVHQLVLEAFVGPCPEGHEVLHLDHNPANNKLSNLKYGTRSENIRMDFQVGGSRAWRLKGEQRA